ncbi:MAG: hypothetical protein A3I12_02010 [Gammaproteobacteria bacterium RIFCSPLOWO2_02_FULL_38_11]|nr:MAG: hypothetical protein A2W47_04020 [Gammaproteobacteria bacterium RIFCSPHIGHO2_12_38_15]OGT66819.1 MAG: hypothetical protein A3I12_02010 [Gammaproteobacteria bacterium RIFCSPLOWO2_02_FULL_38_11]OGT75933.1 MAG: hypothetical protein A3G71_04390 [Gammaproteobacteria bacterium RIFCSPLOWO2_12_FULL_38_14]
MKIVYLIFYFMSGVTLLACSTVNRHVEEMKNRPNTYLHSQLAPPLVVPSGMEHVPLLSDDIVPPGECVSEKMILLPPQSLAMKVEQGVISKKALKPLSSINLEEREGQWALILTDDRERVWDRLDKAFKDRLIPVLQKDKDRGIYYIVDIEPTKNKITLASPIYQVHLRVTQEQNTEVYLMNNQGHIPNKYVAHRLLLEINRGLQGDKLRELPKILKNFMSEK